jgi:hypothetical protein
MLLLLLLVTLVLVTMLQPVVVLMMVWGLLRMNRLRMWLVGFGLVGKARLGMQEGMMRGQRWLGSLGVWVQQWRLTLQQLSSHMGSRLKQGTS